MGFLGRFESLRLLEKMGSYMDAWDDWNKRIMLGLLIRLGWLIGLGWFLEQLRGWLQWH